MRGSVLSACMCARRSHGQQVQLDHRRGAHVPVVPAKGATVCAPVYDCSERRTGLPVGSIRGL